MFILAFTIVSIINVFNSEKLNLNPVIGVLSQASDFNETYPSAEYSYIASHNMKFIEQAGAEVIPILYDYDKPTLKKIFSKINGILLPGGGQHLWKDFHARTGFSLLTETTQYLMKLAIEANLKGDYFPVMGICLGFELMIMAISNDTQSRFILL